MTSLGDTQRVYNILLSQNIILFKINKMLIYFNISYRVSDQLIFYKYCDATNLVTLKYT